MVGVVVTRYFDLRSDNQHCTKQTALSKNSENHSNAVSQLLRTSFLQQPES